MTTERTFSIKRRARRLDGHAGQQGSGRVFDGSGDVALGERADREADNDADGQQAEPSGSQHICRLNSPRQRQLEPARVAPRAGTF